MTVTAPAPRDEAELEAILTEPTPETVKAARDLGGDLLVLGAGGKMGPTLARLAQRSVKAAGLRHRVVAVSRFGSGPARSSLEAHGVETLAADLLDRDALDALPDAPNVAYLAGMKFGSAGLPAMTWALNCYLPALAAERFRASRIVALSTGNVYPMVSAGTHGAAEDTPPGPVGEYAQSCLGRERMLEYASRRHGTAVTLIRLNYANDLRYGVLLDIALRVARRDTIDVTMGHLNAIWQGDANAAVLRAFSLCASPPRVLNVTGPEVLAVRDLARRLASAMGLPEPTFAGVEAPTALLADASQYHALFGPPHVTLDTLLRWTAEWVQRGGPTLGKPTHYEQRDGVF